MKLLDGQKIKLFTYLNSIKKLLGFPFETMPHIIELSPFKKASAFDTAPDFIQHVPPLKFVHTK